MAELEFYSPGENEWKSVLLYGQPRTGKTVCASTAPRPLFLDCEGGLLSIKDRDVKAVRIRSIADLEAAYTWLEKHGKDEKREFDTVVIDSITELQVILVEDLTKKQGAQTPDIRTWGLVFTKMRSITKAFRELPYHLVFTALERTFRDEITGKVYFGPDLLGQSADKVPAYFDFIFRTVTKPVTDSKGLKTGEVSYRLITRGTDSYFAGGRSPVLEIEEEPDLTKIFEKVGAV